MDTLATYKQALAGKSEDQAAAEYKHPFLVKIPKAAVAARIAGAQTAYQERASLNVSRSTFKPEPTCEVFKVIRKETGTFKPGDRVFVGRGEECDITIPVNTMSKRHAYVLADPAGKPFIVEMTSTNGTFLNGKRLVAREQKPLTDGDMVSLGPDTHFAFFTPKGVYQACQETKGPPSAAPPSRLMGVDPVV